MKENSSNNSRSSGRNASGLLNLDSVVSNPLKPLSKDHGFSLHTHKDNSLGILYYYCYLKR
jgi:hypothetical protein